MADGQQPTVPYGDPGIGGVQYPATQTMSLPNILQNVQTISKVLGGGQGANVPFLPQTQISPNIPVRPQMVPTNAPVNVRPTDTSLYARRMANSQGWGNMLGNAIGMVANAKAQETFQKNTKTITDATNYLQGIKNAQLLKQIYPNDPAIQKIADGAIQTNTQGFQNLTSDEKTKKMIGKALSWDFTDPQKMSSDPNIKAGQAGVKAAAEQHAAGIAAVTPQDKQIQQMLEQGGGAARQMGAQGQGLPAGVGAGAPQGAPPTPTQPYQQASPEVAQAQALQRAGGAPAMAGGQMPGGPPAMGGGEQQVRPQNRMEQYLATRPVGFMENPAYEAQQKFDQQVALAMLRNVIPAETRKEGTLGAAQTRAEADVKKEELRAKTQTQIEASRTAREKYKVDETNANRLDVEAERTDRALKEYDIRYGNMAELLKGNPGAARGIGIAAGTIGSKIDKDIQSLGTIVGNRDKQITALQNQLDFGQPTMVSKGLFDKTQVQKYDSKGKPMFEALPAGPERDKVQKQIDLLRAQNDIDNNRVTNLQTSRDNFTTLSNVAADTSAAGQTVGQYSGKPSMTAADFDPKGGFQQWLPMVEQTRQQIAPNVPPPLAAAILMSENARGNPYADPKPDKKGGQGLFQVIPSNQKKFGITNAFDPVNNTEGAMRMLGQLMQESGGDIRKVIYGYAPKDGSDPGYVDRVFNLYKQLASTDVAAAGGKSGEALDAAAAARVGQQAPTPGFARGLTPSTPSGATTQAAPTAPAGKQMTEQDYINAMGSK